LAKVFTLYGTGDLSSTVAGRYGFHQIQQAVENYMLDQTAGKVFLKPALTDSSAKVDKFTILDPEIREKQKAKL